MKMMPQCMRTRRNSEDKNSDFDDAVGDDTDDS